MSPVDLSALRHPEPAAAVSRRPRGPRWFAGSVLALAAAVVASFAWPLLWPPRPVATAAIQAAAAAEHGAGGGPEAVGWVEPDPFPVVVRPLVDGRVESLEVLEGSTVEGGTTVIARLANAALLAASDRAHAMVVERERTLAVAQSNLALAEARLAQNAERRSAELQARVDLAAAEARLARATGGRDRAAALLRSSDAALAAQQRLHEAGRSNDLALARAAAEQQAAAAELAAATAELPSLAAEHTGRRATLDLAVALREQPVDLHFAVQLAALEVARSEAALASATTERAIAARELGWTTVLAPTSGVVLRLLATPGAGTGPGGEGLVALYDPAHLRARIDVPLGSVGGIAADQEVELTSEVTGSQRVRGVVQRLQHESDLLKNTLQVKVRLLDPPELWRPDTLVRARFRTATAPAQATTLTTFVVPAAAVRDGRVFVFDAERRRARAVAVTTLGPEAGGLRVQGELSPAQRVILDAVVDGEAVQELQR
ncbi:MAG: HlyD family efflux transporter periplasmic adaptor subunit [Planctomycetes bacterium]|nr:HlyD family efflux transporter periplasmic adaptor subunit [Planctomycetota bacterium]